MKNVLHVTYNKDDIVHYDAGAAKAAALAQARALAKLRTAVAEAAKAVASIDVDLEPTAKSERERRARRKFTESTQELYEGSRSRARAAERALAQHWSPTAIAARTALGAEESPALATTLRSASTQLLHATAVEARRTGSAVVAVLVGSEARRREHERRIGASDLSAILALTENLFPESEVESRENIISVLASWIDFQLEHTAAATGTPPTPVARISAYRRKEVLRLGTDAARYKPEPDDPERLQRYLGDLREREVAP